MEEGKGLNLPPVGQVGIVVKDIFAAMDYYSKTFGIGPWRVQTNSAPPLRCFYRGDPASYKIKVAIASSGPVKFELIQYLEGVTIHRDFSRTRGEGVEHLGFYVPNLDEALAALAEQGIGVLQRAEGLGASGDGCYAYLDTADKVGTVLELIQSPSRPVPADQVYP